MTARAMHYLRHLARLGTPDIHPAGDWASRRLIDALGLEANQTILELGCGTGNTVRRLAGRGDVYVVGLDLLGEMLSQARRRLKRVAGACSLVRADARLLPFRDQAFDRVYAESSLGIQTSSGIRRVLEEAFRVLRPGGLFVANEAIWKPDVDPATVTIVNRLSEEAFGLRPGSEEPWSTEHWLAEIRDRGFHAVAWSELVARNSGGRLNDLATRCMRRLLLMTSPTDWRVDRAYRQRINDHRATSALLEARLFVSMKPR